MQKDFDVWNEKKKEVNNRTDQTLFHEREIWWCSLGLNIGFEQDGKHDNFERPVLILRKWSKNTFVGLPLTTTLKTGSYFFDLFVNNENSVALLSQSRTLDKRRLLRKMGTFSRAKFGELRESYARLFL